MIYLLNLHSNQEKLLRISRPQVHLLLQVLAVVKPPNQQKLIRLSHPQVHLLQQVLAVVKTLMMILHTNQEKLIRLSHQSG